MGNHAIVLGSNKINHTEALLSFPTTTGTLVGTGDTGSVSNTMLAGSIASSKLGDLLKTDIKIGEDDETKIDFETADEIHFYAANVEQVYLADNIFGPQSDSDVDLGTTGVRWKDAYLDSVTVTDNVTVGGNLTVNGTTTTIDTTNTVVKDSLLGLNNGASSNSNDSGIIIERGSTGNDALLIWDESADKWALGTTTDNASSTGNLNMTTGTLVANIEGNVTGNASGTAATVTGAAQTNITSLGTLTGLTVDGDVTITSTDDGAGADPSLVLYRNSASPAANDSIGELLFRGRNDNSQDVEYGRILGRHGAITDGSENGKIFFQVMNQGTLEERLVFRGNERTRFANKAVELSTGVDLYFEGATANANETQLTVTDPTADRTITLPDATGTVITTGNTSDVTTVGTLTTLTVDNVIINGSTIGHTGDTDLMTVASGVLTVAGEVDATSLDISGDADIDGTLEADAITVNGTALNTVIADEATALAIALG